ncbi:MAG: hypothetical protein IKJ45_16680 [Kiritimatiellae bacterium]|nr:hypothetical protein [Kiritimatiellia bacterium]
MNNKEATENLFNALFGKPGSRGDGKSWDELVFTDRSPKMLFRYVGWVDLMGASHMMSRSIDSASKSIGRLHEAVLKASFTLKLNTSVVLHPMADGVYVVAETYEDVALVFAHVFRSYAQTFIKMNSESRFCPIRAAIAYGRVIDQNVYVRKLAAKTFKKRQEKLLTQYFSNVLHGKAYATAHDAESKAPPFGIFQDESLREFGMTKEKTHITWPLEKWWCSGRSATEQQRTFAESFGQCLINHFNWVLEHPIDSGMDGKDAIDKIDGYKRSIREYFGLKNKEELQ